MSHPPFVAHDPKHVDLEAEQPRRDALHSVPDLRFEYGFLRSVRPYFGLRANDSSVKGKGKESDRGGDRPKCREQCRGRARTDGYAGDSMAGCCMGDDSGPSIESVGPGCIVGNRGALLDALPGQARSFIPTPPEGGIAKWLRSWAHSVVTPSASTLPTPTYTRP
ncbi:hypothetical protein K438DRAFT_1965671 [Mycena galopus ATCC 62051]|nr:hypothetical protein K438DRAFT_1965671 [Mycena galopus ATCC 62051]